METRGEKKVVLTVTQRILTIEINRPEVRNCVDGQTAELLGEAWVRFRDDPDLWVAVLTGSTIALYTLIDGVGVRLTEQALTYITWLFIGEGLAVLYILLPRMQRLKAQPNRQLMLAFGGGLLSALAYALALYAKTKAPLGLVSALRETSVIFAAMIGVFWFGEGPVRTRLCAAAVVVTGIILLALA